MDGTHASADARLPGQPLDSEGAELTDAVVTPEPTLSGTCTATNAVDATREGLGKASNTDTEDVVAASETEAPLDGSYFPRYRFSRFTGMHQYLCFGIYVPFGIVLFSLRVLVTLCMLLWISLCCCSRQGYSNRGCSLHHIIICIWHWMMINTTLKGDRHSQLPRVLVSNHVSEADVLPIAYLFPVRTVAMDYIRTTPVIGRICSVHDPIWIGQPENAQSTSRNMTLAEIATFKEKQREMLRKAVLEGTAREDSSSVLIFPEGVLTSGRVAILRYQKFVFSLGLQVQPLAISRKPAWIQRHFFPVEVDTARASFIANVLWLYFLPRGQYQIVLLKPMERGEKESPAAFADRVQVATAAELGLIPSCWGNREKNSFFTRDLGKFLDAGWERDYFLPP